MYVQRVGMGVSKQIYMYPHLEIKENYLETYMF